MKVTNVEAIPLEVGFAETFSFGTTDRRSPFNVLVRVVTDRAVVGVGEACPIPAFTAETRGSVVAAVDTTVRELLVGQDPRRRGPLLRSLRAALPDAPFTRTAVDLALWDVVGKVYDAPVHELLGGAYRDEAPQHGSVGMGTAEQMVAAAGRQLRYGYGMLKLYAGRQPLDDDLARLAAVRDAVGDTVEFLLDVNGRWDRDTALRALPRLADLGVVLLEQPVPADDLDGLAALTAHCAGRRIRVMVDESVYGPADVAEVAAHRAAHAVNVGLSKLGGLTSAYECAVAASAGGLQVAVGSVLELDVASAAGLHLAACLPEPAAPSYLVGPLKYERQLTDPPLTVCDGAMAVPQGPGLGVTVADV